MITEGINAFRNKRVLLLQGPLGPFFRRLACDLENIGAKVFKVNFNGGDWFFYPTRAINYRGDLEAWPDFFERLLTELSIDVVFLFGDCRPIHKLAHEIANRHGVEIGVFEEGYIRPDYITLERYGVNGNSLIPRNQGYYFNVEPVKNEFEKVGNTFWYAALWAALYYLAGSILWPCFHRNRHHRPLSFLETWPWVKSVWRKWYYAIREYGILDRLKGPLAKKFFLVPLQVHYDAQIHIHSKFNSVHDYISEVIASFAAHAPKDTILVLKHHPMDRGYIDYSSLIGKLVCKYCLENRCFYIHDQNLPALLKRTRGVVVINSTVGLSAIHHGAPVKVCGIAIYDIKGLTYQGSLDRFWNESGSFAPNHGLYERFRSFLIRRTQLNGSFYKRLHLNKMHSGIRWKETNYPEPENVDRKDPVNIPEICERNLKNKELAFRLIQK